MSTTAASPTPPAAEPPFRPITVAMYTRMLRHGIIGEDEPVYLWSGRLAGRMPPNPPHSDAVKGGYDLLSRLLPAGFDIDRERPMALTCEPSVPQPDIVLIRGRFRDFAPEISTSAAVALVIEVSDTSLAKDRRLCAIYAGEGIPHYWIVNLAERQVEVHSDPSDGVYRVRAVLGAEDALPIVLDGREVGRIRVNDLLP